MNVILYTTHCPKCKILTQKLQANNIEYTEFTSIEGMLEKGFVNVPILEIDGIVMDFVTANNWINERKLIK